MASNRKLRMQAKRDRKKLTFKIRKEGEPGNSKYAKTKRGEHIPDRGSPRASWMVRFGLVARAERALANDTIDVAV